MNLLKPVTDAHGTALRRQRLSTAAPSRKFILVFGSIWSAMTCVCLALLFSAAVKQVRALSFATTQGVVDSAWESIEEKGATGARISYHFTVKGHPYTSDQIRFMQGSSTDSWASEMVHQFARGTRPTVYYNPANPAESVLVPGLQGQDLFVVMFLTPFTMVMLAIWWAFVNTFPRTGGFSGLKVLEEGTRTRIRPSHWQPVAVTGVVLGLSAFLSIFIVGFFFGGFHPPMAVAEIAWALILILSLSAGVATWWSILSGAEDIVLNELTQTMHAPKGVTMAYHDIAAIETAHSEKQQYEVWLHYKIANETQKLRLEKWIGEEKDASRFAEWLGKRLAVPVHDAGEQLSAEDSKF